MASKMDARLLKSTKFPPEFNQKVDMEKVNLQVMKKWITKRISEILGNEDDVVIELCFNLIEASRYPDIKSLQIQLTGFLDKDTATFCKELWNLLLSGQSSPQGVPKELLEAKKLELMQERACFRFPWTPIESQIPVRVATCRVQMIDSIATPNPSQTRGTHRNVVQTVPSPTAVEAVIMVEEDRDRRHRDPEVVGRVSRTVVSCTVVIATFPRLEVAVRQLRDASRTDHRCLRAHRGLALVAAASLAAADARRLRRDADFRPLERKLPARETGLPAMLAAATTIATVTSLVAVLSRAPRNGCRLQPSAGVGPGRAVCRQIVSDGAIRLRLVPAIEGRVAAVTGAAGRTATTVGANRLRADGGTDAAYRRTMTMNTVVIKDAGKADAAWPAGSAEADTILLAGGVTALPNLHFHLFVANQLMFWKMTIAPPLAIRPRRAKTHWQRWVPIFGEAEAPDLNSVLREKLLREKILKMRPSNQSASRSRHEAGVASKSKATAIEDSSACASRRRMGDNKQNNAPVVMAEYKKAQTRVRELVERRRAQERKLAQLEEGIALKESTYLESTPAGNIITGFESYMKGASGAAAQRRKTSSADQNRVFSRSSISYRPNNASQDSSTPGASTPASHTPTPLSASFRDSASAHQTPMPNKSSSKAKRKDGDEGESQALTSKKRTSFGAVRK
ncbi:hypothetical protein CP532_5200 [Ophiocordyceps camponoti-leonardi (nom. inval.)]|nr:hypothetical protein CP532_5200 [Ophiocordyceps camponoti-leonardi (nom. inval.)]